MSRRSRGTVALAGYAVACFSLAHTSLGQTQNEQWTGGGDGVSYSAPANWTPLLALPPVNTGGVGFNVDVPYVSAHTTVRYDQVLGNGQINQLSLADNMTLRLQDTVATGTPNVTGLTVLNAATINGIIDANNANFTANGTLTPGNAARFWAANSAVVNVAAAGTYSSVGLPGSATLMSADGTGSQLNLSALSGIDGGFYLAYAACTHTIVARNSGQINLSGVQSVLGPVESDDTLKFSVESGGLVNLAGLQSVNGQEGMVDFSVVGTSSSLSMGAVKTLRKANLTVSGTGNTILLPAIQSVTDTTFTAGSNTSIQAVGAAAPYSSAGLAGSATLMSADGTGSQLNLSALSGIDGGFYLAYAACTHTIVARNSGQINLSGVQSVLGPVESDDTLKFSVESGGLVNLAGLQSVNGQEGMVDFSVVGTSSSLSMGAVKTLRKANLTVSGTGNTILLPAIQSVTDTTFTAGSNTSIQAVGAAAPYSSAGLAGSATLMSADGTGSQLNLSALSGIDGGFYLAYAACTHTIVARNSGQINLSGVQSVLGPVESDDTLKFSVESGGLVNLAGLQSVNGQEGMVDFSVVGTSSSLSMGAVKTLRKANLTVSGTGNTILLPAIQSVTDTTFTAGSNTSIQAVGAAAPYSSAGLAGSATLMSADGTGSQLNLSALSGIDGGFYLAYAACTHTIVARNSGQINLSGVQSVLGPVESDDTLKFSVESGGLVNLAGLQSVNGQEGMVDFSVVGTSSSLSMGAVKTLRKANLTVSGTGNTISLPAIQSLTDVAYLAVSGTGTSLSMPNLQTLSGGAGTMQFTLTDGGSMRIGQLTNPTVVGQIAFTGTPSTLTVDHTLNLGNVPVTVAQSATLNVRGKFAFGHTDEASLQLADSLVRLNGSRIQTLEIGGVDVGLATQFLANDNFAFGKLVVDQGADKRGVLLMDRANNGNRGGFGGAAEALYLFGQDGSNGLEILNGSILAIGRYHVYALIDSVLTDIGAMFAGPQQKLAFGGGYIQNVLFGDFSDDGTINALDISPFVMAVTNPAGYHASHPGVNLTLVDLNGDGVMNALDINPFIRLVTGDDGSGGAGSAAAMVPEPATAALLALGAMALLRRR